MRPAWATAQALYLFAPLLVSVAISAVVHKYDLFRALAKPIDRGATLGGRRVFGDGKTWRGVAIAVAGCVLTVLVQKYAIGARAGDLAVLDYERVNAWWLGSGLGAGAMAGELPNSFVKRRLGIARGGTAERRLARAVFWTWDQVDLLTTAWPVIALFARPRVEVVLASFGLALVLHPLIALIGFLIGARRTAR